MTEPAIVVQKAYDWTLWILPKVEHFPKSYRFSVGQNLISSSLDLLMNLVDTSYQSRNAGELGAAVRNVNRVRYLMRLSKDLRLINLNASGVTSKPAMEGHFKTGQRTSTLDDSVLPYQRAVRQLHFSAPMPVL